MPDSATRCQTVPRRAANALLVLSPSKGIPPLPLQPCCGVLSGEAGQLTSGWVETLTSEANPDFFKYQRREQAEQPDLPSEP